MDQVETVSLDVNAAPAATVVAPPTPIEFSGKGKDFAADMALLKAELEPAPVVPAPTPEATQPATTAPATAPATVPDKFKDAEGNLDAAKLEKSTASAQEALTKYLALEKELRQKANAVSGLKNQAPQIAAPNEAPAPATPFAAQLEADMAKYGAGVVLERLFEAAKETAKNEVLSDVKAEREERLERKSREELSEIAKFDQGVLTPEGLDRLAQIRAERPWMEKAPNPTSEAYKVYLAEQVLKARQTGTVLPNPSGLTAQPKAVPVGPAPRVVVQSAPKLESQADIEAHIRSLTPAQEAAFWKSRGLRFK